MPVTSSMVTIETPHGDMPTHVASPAGTAPRPGVVVIHDFTGMSHDLRNQADWLAQSGGCRRLAHRHRVIAVCVGSLAVLSVT